MKHLPVALLDACVLVPLCRSQILCFVSRSRPRFSMLAGRRTFLLK